jgi:hypothetical protein
MGSSYEWIALFTLVFVTTILLQVHLPEKRLLLAVSSPSKRLDFIQSFIQLQRLKILRPIRLRVGEDEPDHNLLIDSEK